MTELGKSPDEVGSWDFPFVIELLKYWEEYPPAHLLLRAMARYEGRKGRDPRRERAMEMQDETYKPSEATQLIEKPTPEAEDQRLAMKALGNTLHLDNAPTHIQEAVARAKRNEHMKISPPISRG